MAGQILLARLGQPSELRIGVAKDTLKGLKAHAWLETSGRVVLGETEPGEYTPLEAGAPRVDRQDFRPFDKTPEA
jgi:hypothetical protein